MKQLMDETAIKTVINRMAYEIIERNPKLYELVFVGVKTRGQWLAKRLSDYVALLQDVLIPWCGFDVSGYRDDIDVRHITREELLVPIVNKTVVLTDDVLFSGRTIRAAIDGVIASGRPKEIQLAVLIDRGHRRLPIKADYIGKNIPTRFDEWVEVKFQEQDNTEGVFLKKSTIKKY